MRLPQLRSDQFRIATHPAKTKVLAMGRRWGKTIMSGTMAMVCASQGGRVAWVVPTYKNGRPLWRWAESVTGALKRYGVRINRSERTIEFPNNGFLGLYSADSEDGLRGEAFHLVIVDEAARVSETTYTDVIQPTLADYGGDIVLISTPYGKNWFYHEWVNASQNRHEAMAWTAASNANPNPNIRRAFDLARQRVPERTFRAEWLAEFVEDGGEVFRNVRACAIGEWLESGIAGRRYVIGVDLAKLNDFTVFVVIDIENQAVVYWDRFNQIDYMIQLQRLQVLCDRFQPQTVVIERNIGEMFIEMAYRIGIPAEPFQTTAQSKQSLIDNLVLAFERQDIILPAHRADVLINELQAFTMERLPAGALRYSAPQGLHDDAVIALALAWHAVQSSVLLIPILLG